MQFPAPRAIADVKMGLVHLYNKHGFTVLFWISLAAIIACIVYGWLSGSVGKFTDHTALIRELVSMGQQHSPSLQSTNHRGGDSSGEIECRRVAELITGRPFVKARPDFLKNSVTDANLELDCFNAELGVGIEYNGRQHYEFVPHFHRNRDAFMTTKYRDEMKARLCKEHGVRLIVVPYTVKIDQIESFLRQRM